MTTTLPAPSQSTVTADLAVGPAPTREASRRPSEIAALLTCAIAALLATPLAYALYHRAGSGGAVIGRLVSSLPVAVPALTLGFGYILVFSTDQLPWMGSLPLLIAAHVVLTLPYLTHTLLADLRHLGLAARFVSGYLIQLQPDVAPLEGPLGPASDFTDLHAWAEVYLPGAADEGRWTQLLSGEKKPGGRWHRETHGFLSMPLYVAPNSVIPWGAETERPDYDYARGTVLRVFELAEGVSAPFTVVGLDGQVAARGTVTRDGAVWITHLRTAETASTPAGFKLPAARVLGDRLEGVPDLPVAASAKIAHATWRDIVYDDGALAVQRAGDRATDAAGRAGDERGLAGKVEHWALLVDVRQRCRRVRPSSGRPRCRPACSARCRSCPCRCA